jgi:hypothetical protein
VGDIYFKIIFALKNSNKFLNSRFWKEILVENMRTLGPMAHATLDYL